jgi:hypothetical protein
MAKFKIQKVTADVGSYGISTGLTGGLTSLTGNQIQPRVKIGSNANANGSILAAKGSRKFKVTDGTNTGICTLVNKANGSLADDEMNILCTKADTSTFYAKRINNKFVWDFSDNKYLVGTAGTTSTDPDTVAVARA